MSKILVTGSKGFIGTNLCKRLIQDGHEVHSYDVKEEMLNDVIEHTCFETIPANVDIIYHLASIVGVDNVERDPYNVIKNNEELDNKIINLCKRYNNKLYFTSTSEMYWNSDNCKEDDNLSLLSPEKERGSYAFEKLHMEYKMYFELPEKNRLILRLFNIVGYGQKKGFVFREFIEKALKNEDIIVYGDGEQIRTFLDIDECIDIILKLQDHYGTIYNIGNPKNKYTINELAEVIIKETNSKSKIIHQGNRIHEIYTRIPNIDKIKKDIKFEPKVSLKEMIRKYINERNKNINDT